MASHDVANNVYHALTAGSVRDVAGSKVGGLARIEAAGLSSSAGQPLGSMVMFSSISALMGSAGQVGYSGANAVLDAWAVRLAAAGRARINSRHFN
jgi:hypothetical protein